MAKDLVKLTGLWEDTDRNGHQYFSGKINAISKFLVMPNTFKNFWLCLTPLKKRTQTPTIFCM
jgi:hypothetical protein